MKKLLERAEERNRGKIPTATLKAIFTATNEDQVNCFQSWCRNFFHDFAPHLIQSISSQSPIIRYLADKQRFSLTKLFSIQLIRLFLIVQTPSLTGLCEKIA